MASRNVDIRHISKILIITVTLSVGVIVMLFLAGFLSEMYIGESESRFERHSLGFNNPNILGGYFIALAYAFFVIFKARAKTFIGILLFTVVSYLITGSRTLLCTVLVLLACFYIFQIRNTSIRRFAIFLIPIVALADIVFLYQFSYGPLENELDILSSYRFSYIYRLIHNVPITLFGDSTIFTKDSDAFDNSYAYFVLNFGVVGTTVFILSIFFGALKHINDVKLLSLCLAVCFAGLLESRMYDPIMAFPLLKLIVDGADIRLPRSRPA